MAHHGGGAGQGLTQELVVIRRDGAVGRQAQDERAEQERHMNFAFPEHIAPQFVAVRPHLTDEVCRN